MKKIKYDVVIIGAGIGGLVCGCYLAKAGKKVLIVEKNDKPGGYCNSFDKQGFSFDTCVHSLGSCGNNRILSTILEELNVLNKIEIIKYDPSDTILSPDYKINIKQDLNETIYEFETNFPRQALGIKSFFDYISRSDVNSLLIEIRKKTFKDILDEYFDDYKLKALLSILLLGNVGLPPSLVSAVTAVMIYREFIFDGGYYPRGGIKIIPEVLTQQFLNFGGEVLFSNLVTEIKVNNCKIEGIVVSNNCFIPSKYVISNCDMYFTFMRLIKQNKDFEFLVKRLKEMTPSISALSIYLGASVNLNKMFGSGANLWILPSYDIENMYEMIKKGQVDNKKVYSLCFFPSVHDRNLSLYGKESLCLFVNAPFKSRKFWNVNRGKKVSRILKRNKMYIPYLDKFCIKAISDPVTLYDYTLNYNGAAYGWAAVSSQILSLCFVNSNNIVAGLFFVGHWTTQGHGVPTVAYQGKKVASLILKKYNKKLR